MSLTLQRHTRCERRRDLIHWRTAAFRPREKHADTTILAGDAAAAATCAIMDPTHQKLRLGPREVLRPIEGLQLKRRMHGFEIGVAMNQGDAVLHRDRGNETIRSRGRHSVFS